MRTRLLACVPFALALAACGGHPVSPTAPPGLDGEADQAASAATPNGQKVGEVLHGVAPEEDAEQDFRFALDPKNCYTISGVGENTVRKLSLDLFDPKDDRVEDDDGDGRVLMKYCPEEPGMFRLRSKVGDGKGHFAIAVYAYPPPPKEAPPPAEAPAPTADLGALVEAEAKATAAGASRVGDFYSGSAEKTDWFTQLEAGQCYWFVGVGQPGDVNELYLYLWDSGNSRVTESKAVSNKAVLGHCPKTTGMYKVQAKVNSGSGPYKMGLYAKSAK